LIICNLINHNDIEAVAASTTTTTTQQLLLLNVNYVSVKAASLFLFKTSSVSSTEVIESALITTKA